MRKHKKINIIITMPTLFRINLLMLIKIFNKIKWFYQMLQFKKMIPDH